MPSFKFLADSREFIKEVAALEYAGGSHQHLFDGLQNVAQFVSKPMNPLEVSQGKEPVYMHPVEQQAILLGAAIFARECVKEEYSLLRAQRSTLVQAIESLSLLKQVLAVDNRELTEKFALKAFDMWFRRVALDGDSVIKENPYYGKEKDNVLFHKQIMGFFSKHTSALPEINSDMYRAISGNNMAMNASGFSLRKPDQGFSLASYLYSGISTMFGSSAGDKAPEESKKAEKAVDTKDTTAHSI